MEQTHALEREARRPSLLPPRSWERPLLGGHFDPESSLSRCGEGRLRTEESWALGPESLTPARPADLPQVEVTKAYFAKQVDEISLQQADVVLVLQQEDGKQGVGGREGRRGDTGEGLSLGSMGEGLAEGPRQAGQARVWPHGHGSSPGPHQPAWDRGPEAPSDAPEVQDQKLCPSGGLCCFWDPTEAGRAGWSPETLSGPPGGGGGGLRGWGCRAGPSPVPGTRPHLPVSGSGWFYGERLRDGETGWFPEDFVQSITNRVAVESNMRRMERLRVETDV